MTGSLLLNRQHSSTAGFNKMARPKLRRCSSADDHSSHEVTPDENQYKKSFFSKRDPIASEDDSGIEDFDQQIVNHGCSQTNDANEESPSPCFGALEDDVIEDNSTPIMNAMIEYSEQIFSEPNYYNIFDDLYLAAQVPDDEKKDFCIDTCQVFHAEFARRISCCIALHYPGVHYCLLAEDEVDSDPCYWPGFDTVKLDNAKAQFKCPNPMCRRLWTSMRARISFKISQPQPNGFVVLKIFGQNCQQCQTPSDALWYIEEVCRVMENLSKFMMSKFFPQLITYDDIQGEEITTNVGKYSRGSRHDPHQRKGKMHAPHDKNNCEACQYGWCYA